MVAIKILVDKTYVRSCSNPPLVIIMRSLKIWLRWVSVIVNVKKSIYKPLIINMVPVSVVDFG